MKANAATTSSATSPAAPDAQKLDRLIDSLKGPKAISTVTKSSVDWDSYKTKEGIDEDELVAAKDGYVAPSSMNASALFDVACCLVICVCVIFHHRRMVCRCHLNVVSVLLSLY